MTKVLGRQTSGNVQKVLFLLEEMGRPFEREDYGRQFGNTETDEYRSLNPTAKVPTLVDGDVTIWESNTILRYLADRYGQAFHGETPAERSQVERWMDWVLASVNPGYLAAFKETKKPAAERDPAFAAQAKELVTHLELANAHLSSQEFFALGRLTLADIALGPILCRCLDFPMDRPSLPNLEAWAARIKARPAFAAATGAAPARTANAA